MALVCEEQHRLANWGVWSLFVEVHGITEFHLYMWVVGGGLNEHQQGYKKHWRPPHPNAYSMLDFTVSCYMCICKEVCCIKKV